MSASSSLAGEMGDVPPDGPVDIDALEVGQVFLSIYRGFPWVVDFYCPENNLLTNCVLIPLKDREYEVQKCPSTFTYRSHVKLSKKLL